MKEHVLGTESSHDLGERQPECVLTKIFPLMLLAFCFWMSDSPTVLGDQHGVWKIFKVYQARLKVPSLICHVSCKRLGWSDKHMIVLLHRLSQNSLLTSQNKLQIIRFFSPLIYNYIISDKLVKSGRLKKWFRSIYWDNDILCTPFIVCK